MKLVKKIRKGFTLVELVVVIAVIAILAAVSAITYVGIMNSANNSMDVDALGALNRASASVEVLNKGEKPLTMHQALTDLNKLAGISNPTKFMKSQSKVHEFAYHLTTNRFVLLEGNDVTECDTNLDALGSITGKEYEYWKVVSEPELTSYSIYFDDNANLPAKFTVWAGCDLGNNIETYTGEIIYENTTTTKKAVKRDGNSSVGKEVVIRTNSFETKLTINGTTEDTVIHYGYAGLVEVKKVAMASYDEFGTVGRLFATSEGATGHIDIKAGATVYQVEQLGGTATKVSIDANATVYDINQNKVEGAVVGTTERFTETITETHTDDERVTAVECTHPKTEDVIDGQHVYEVCKKCGYTVIKVDGIKKTVADEESENVIIPKASYDGSQVTAGAENGEVQINKNEDGSYVTPSIAQTPIIDTTNTKAASCEHNWTHSHDGEQCIKSCSKCGLSFADEHIYHDDANHTFYAKCPTCNATLGTDEIPYHISNGQEYFDICSLTNKFITTSYSFKLVNDIDISNTTGFRILNVNGVTSPMYYFRGTIDGCGHKIYENNKFNIRYTLGDVTIKNIDFIECNKDDNFAIICYANAYEDYKGKITFENVNIMPQDPNLLYTAGTSYWCAANMPATNCEMIFKNCNNYINYNSTASYTGIFFGNYGVASTKFTFINVNNYGNITGSNLGYFNGNGNGKILQLLATPSSKPDSDKVGYYIENCNNYGSIKTTVSYSPFSTYASYNALTSITAMNELIIERNLFTPGEVSVGGIDLTLTKDGTLVKINEVDSAKIANYKVTVYVGCGGKNDSGDSWGSSYFKIGFEFAKDAPQKSLSFIKAFVMSDTYSTAYDQIQSEEKETEEGILYKEVADESGITIVINTESAIADVAASLNSSHIASVTCGSAPSYRIDAYDTNGINLGSKTYSASELPN